VSWNFDAIFILKPVKRLPHGICIPTGIRKDRRERRSSFTDRRRPETNYSGKNGRNFAGTIRISGGILGSNQVEHIRIAQRRAEFDPDPKTVALFVGDTPGNHGRPDERTAQAGRRQAYFDLVAFGEQRLDEQSRPILGDVLDSNAQIGTKTKQSFAADNGSPFFHGAPSHPAVIVRCFGD
jgi:hypothetical protein